MKQSPNEDGTSTVEEHNHTNTTRRFSSACLTREASSSAATAAATTSSSSSVADMSFLRTPSPSSTNMQFQGNDGSPISITIPSRVVNRRPSDESVHQKKASVGGLGEYHRRPEPMSQPQKSMACKRSSSSPTNTGGATARTSATSATGSSRRPMSSPLRHGESPSPSPSTSNKRMKPEDDGTSTCTAGDRTSLQLCLPEDADAAEGSVKVACVSSAITTPSASTARSLSSSPSLPPAPPSPSSSSCRAWRTDGTKPKRPMTAYNYFFREQRNLIKSMGLESYRTMMEGKRKGDSDSNSNGSNKSNVAESSEGGPSATTARGSSKEDATTATADTTATTTTNNNNNNNNTSKPPPQAQDTTKPPLQVMAKTVAHYWKRVSSTDLHRYQKLAKQDKERYRSEMKEYKAMLQDRQDRLDRQREEQSLAAANNAAAAAAASASGGLVGMGRHLAGGASSSSWTPEQMSSIFGYLNQAQMDQFSQVSSNGAQDQQLLANAQNAMIGQLQDQIRSLQEQQQQNARNNANSGIGADITTTGTDETERIAAPAQTASSSSRGILNRLETQASIMRLQIERAKDMNLGAASPSGQSGQRQQAQPMSGTGDEGTNHATALPNIAATGQTCPPSFVGDDQDASLGSASGACAISLVGSTVPPHSTNGTFYAQPPTAGAQDSLPTPNPNVNSTQVRDMSLAPSSSNPPASRGWASTNPLNGMMPPAPMDSFLEERPMPTQPTAGLPFQQQRLSSVSSISGTFTSGMGQRQAQYQSQRSSVSALSDHLPNFDESSNGEETLDAFSIAQMLFGPDSGKNDAK